MTESRMDSSQKFGTARGGKTEDERTSTRNMVKSESSAVDTDTELSLELGVHDRILVNCSFGGGGEWYNLAFKRLGVPSLLLTEWETE